MRAAGVPESAISIIPDEQQAIEAALRMGEAGDLLLIFADALVRSWKQITKFKTAGAAATPSPHRRVREATGGRHRSMAAGSEFDVMAAPVATPEFNLEGLIRDERGIHMAPESED